MEGVEGKLKVWIRRVWTLEMVSLHLPALSLGPPCPAMIADFDDIQSVIGLR